MNANNLLGIIFSNAQDSCLSEMTDFRTMGSVPFCGRYRLIDFPLSFMVNSGMTKIGVITRSNYQSLMYHLGTGNPWDLSRKTDGLYILPPFSVETVGAPRGRIESLSSISDFMLHSKQEYIVMCDCNVVCNLDIQDMLNRYHALKADILIGYTHGSIPRNISPTLAFNLNEDKRIVDAVVSPKLDGEYNYSNNVYIISKSLLLNLINDAISRNYQSFERDIIQRNINKYRICGYEIENFAYTIDGLLSYFNANMSLLKPENRRALFLRERPVFTKVRDDMPSKYGLGSSVRNSLIADGCIIDGEVENSILFRGVRVGKHASIKNSIVMQNSYVSENAELSYVILDKSVVIKPEIRLSGASTFPIYINKGETI